MSTTFKAENVFLPPESPFRCIAIKRFTKENAQYGEKEAATMEDIQRRLLRVADDDLLDVKTDQNTINALDELHFLKFYAGFSIDSEYIIIYELLDWTRPLTLTPSVAYYTHTLGTAKTFNPYSVLAKISIQLLSSLEEINKAGYCHCDVKPENILYIDRHFSNKIKLIDFGNAIPMSDLTLYFDEFQLQSQGYRAPEVLLGDSTTNEKLDIWSVGVILLELLVNHIFKSFQNRWVLIETDSRPQNVLAITNAIEPLDVYSERNAKYWENDFSLEKLESYGLVSEPGAMIKSLATVAKTEQELNAIDFILCMVQVDNSKRWPVQKVLRHPFLIKTLQNRWARPEYLNHPVPSNSFVSKYLG